MTPNNVPQETGLTSLRSARSALGRERGAGIPVG